MSFTPIIVTATFTRPDGTPASGTVTATLSEPITNGSAGIDPAPVVGVLDAAGLLLTRALGPFTLTANDDPATTPAGSTYEFLVELDDAPVRSFTAIVPHTAASGTIDLTALEA